MGGGTAASAMADIGLRIIKEKEARIEKLESALREIAANTYGTEPCNSDAENNEILGGHLVRFQNIAREALAK
jgi:hypothetical protein